jgi:hypothetical protein
MGIVESQSLAGAAQNPAFQSFPGVMAVTLPRDERCSDPIGLGASFVLSGGPTCKKMRVTRWRFSNLT